jgi:DNA invertase Pin-like site-specific DNA recombinase
MKHAAIYVRVSSVGQDTASQELDLKAWAERQQIPVRWYTDKASGTTMDRAAFNTLLDAMRRGEVECMTVWRMDRLGRNVVGLVKLFDEMRALRVNLISLRDSFDLATAGGRLQANILASVACYETEIRRERQMAGIAAAKAAGRKWGGCEKGRLLTVTPEQVTSVKRMKAEGTGVTQIARATGLSRPTVYRLLA